MSVLSAILDAVVETEQAAGLLIGGNAITVVKRKLPTAGDAVDAAYQVTVSGAEDPERCRRIAFNSRWMIVYVIEITLIVPTADMLTNLDSVTNWREAVRRHYMGAGVLSDTAVKRVEVEPGTLFDRSLLAANYDYDQVVLSLWTYENRS